MKKKLIPLLSALLTVILLATLALFSVAESTEPKLKIAYCTLEFGQDTHILYAVSSEGVENVDDIEVLVWNAPQTDYTSDPDVTLKISYKETINNVEHAVFEFTDLGAMNMADNYYACAHVKVDGEDIYSPVNKYSVLQYAYNMLGKAEKTATTDEKLKNLLNTMLNYGSNVQLYADYKTDRLSNDKWYYVKVNGGTLEDGFDHGLYLKDDEITVTLNDGESFSYWVDDNGAKLSDEKTFTITVSDLLGDDEKTVITISAKLKASEGLEFWSNKNGTCYVSGIGTCTDTDIVIPKTSSDGDKVTRIGYIAFYGCTSLTSITIPDSVKSIGGGAFQNCTNLGKVYYKGTADEWSGISISYDNGDLTYATRYYYSETEPTVAGYFWHYVDEVPTIWKMPTTFNYTINDDNATCTITGLVVNTEDELIIPETIDGYKVTAIGENAFYNNKTFTSVTIPDSVTSIDDQAFYFCTSLKSVTIPDSVTSIDDQAFYYCTSLESITVDESNSVYHSAGNSLIETAGKVLILGCKNSVIPTDGSVTSIGGYAFYDCTSLTSITIPDSVTSIGNYAFYGCTSLTSVTIPDSVTSIGNYAFYGCTSLTSVTIPNSVTSIGGSAFYWCTSLTSITIPDSVTSIGSSAFYGTAYYNNNANWTDGVLYIGNHLIEAKTSISGAYTIKNGTKCIAYGAFKNCKSLTSITIPDSVTSIGNQAFSSCTSLTSVTIGNGVTSIGSSAFDDCTSLGKVYYKGTADKWSKISVGNYNSKLTNADRYYYSETEPTVAGYFWHYVDEVPTIWKMPTTFNYTINDDNATCTITGLAANTEDELIIPETIDGYKVTAIGNSAFEYNKTFTSVIIPDSVTSIGSSAFYDCTSLTSVTIGKGVTSIGLWAFGYCSSLTNITIPNGVTSIDGCAFYYCTSLTSVTIGKGVTSIGLEAFEDCSSLTSITIPDSVTSIGNYAFYGCTSLTSVTIPDSVTSIGVNAFCNTAYYNNNANWTDGVLYIGNHLIKAKDNISGAYTIKNGTKCIANYAFYKCTNLTSIIIPDSVTSIDRNAFYGCSSLKKVYYKGTANEWTSNITIGNYNSYLTNATRYYYSETEPTTRGYFWHYDASGNVTEW